MKRIQIPLLSALAVVLSIPSLQAEPDSVPTGFVTAGKDFPTSDKNLRKWETPIVADLDQDGWVDMVLNEHGYAIQIVWNEKGRYAKPWDLMMGDSHGVTIGDYDQDGLYELVVSRGGGSGSNARNSVIYKVGKDRSFERMPEFDEPLAYMRGRTVKLLDGDNDGDLDLLNFAFPSREKNGASENYIYKNNGEGGLVLESTLPYTRRNGQKVLITDFDNDGTDDLILYGEGAIRAFRGNGDLTYVEVGKTVFKGKIQGVTGAVEIDYDNDGDFDIFLTRGHEIESGATFYDPETQVWGFKAVRENVWFEDVAIGDVMRLENFQSPWPNMKIFTGEPAHSYTFEGETHSGKDIRFVNSDTLGWPDHLNNKGLYLGFVGNEKWRFVAQAGSPMTGVVHGVKGLPASLGEDGPSDVLLENRGGKFVDVSEKVGLGIPGHSNGVATGDFDNNGFEDLIVIRRGNLVTKNESVLWLNQGDGTFKKASAHGVVSPELGAIGFGAEAYDYNKDGKVDVLLGNERGKWHLFKNQKLAKGNYLLVDLGAPAKGKASSLGALVSIEAGKAKQVKRAGSDGAPYARSFDRFVHFGLGDYEGPVSVTVLLSNGETFEKTVGSVNSVLSF
ncbi:FG-GAP repeat domain-containing protein [Pelagicoccus mobilis]|uniref:CRTAC1 family protein n=1 Tax=Pelagicoccus mobilis TaxID=415221 RepID=A0A934VNK8_9BACT|nr:VCBS repeat-containing protein [Pelagicoccus mobilis]MBK1880056.1 CRTAC1 family protein [Pelagicoccus mobilis]